MAIAQDRACWENLISTARPHFKDAMASYCAEIGGKADDPSPDSLARHKYENFRDIFEARLSYPSRASLCQRRNGETEAPHSNWPIRDAAVQPSCVGALGTGFHACDLQLMKPVWRQEGTVLDSRTNPILKSLHPAVQRLSRLKQAESSW
ncbi:hypothetical protein GX48_08161 [Paracoccidioides brasiliensis]|nr:hypothetical protein GX48_08161 [Paracoccidioides brasiliensis]